MNSAANPRALYLLGRRIERLMLMGVLLVVLCFVEAYLATANRQLINDRSVDVITTLLDRLAIEEQRLKVIFETKPEPPAPRASQLSGSATERNLYAETRKKLGLPPPLPPKPPKPRPKQLTYAEALNALVGEVAKGSTSRKIEFEKYIDPTKPPGVLIQSLRQEKLQLDSKPTTVWGIQTPRLLQVQYAGQDFKIPFGFLSGILAIALAPLIIGWLGALYMTRQRELIHISDVEDYKVAFPHILNFLPVTFDKVEHRIKSRQSPKFRAIARTINRIAQSLLRSAVILLFTVPMVVGFAYSLYQLWEVEIDAFSMLFQIGAFLVMVMTIQSLKLIMQEWMFLHMKEFYE